MSKSACGAWAELLRVSALFTVPGDAFAGAAALRVRPNGGTVLALGSSLCLYEAGMALNDWADREEDGIDRPHRPIPSGRIAPGSALTAAVVLTGAGLALSAAAGRGPLALATALAGTVWSYDLYFKHTRGGPAAMAAARSLDLLLGAAATRGVVQGHAGHGRCRSARAIALRPGSRRPHLRRHICLPAGDPGRLDAALAALRPRSPATLTELRRRGGCANGGRPARGPASDRLLRDVRSACAYARTAGKPFLHAALNPSPPLTQRAVGGGIRAMIPLQAALAARAGGQRHGPGRDGSSRSRARSRGR